MSAEAGHPAAALPAAWALLNGMPSAVNQSKGNGGPDNRQSPANLCRYVEVCTAAKHRWRLSVDSRERAALLRFAEACPNRTIAVRGV